MDTQPTFTTGQIVYDRKGHKAKYLTNSKEGHIVQPEMEAITPDGESFNTYYDGLQCWYEVFAKPPRAVLDKEIAELEAKRKALNEQNYKIASDIRAAETDAKARLDKVKRYKGLELLEDFIDSKITHYVVAHWSNIQILPFGATETTDKGKDWKRPHKLLVLFGDSKGDLSWKLSDYAVDSYYRQEVFPCTSEQAAKDKAKELLDAIYAEWRADHKKNLGYAVDSAKKLGFEIPADVAEYTRESAIKSAEERVKNTMAQLATHEAELNKLKCQDARPVSLAEEPSNIPAVKVCPPAHISDDEPF